jgi:hypothetical protein
MNELPSARRHLTLHARTRGPGDGTVQLRLSGAAQVERHNADGAVQLRWSGAAQVERHNAD